MTRQPTLTRIQELTLKLLTGDPTLTPYQLAQIMFFAKLEPTQTDIETVIIVLRNLSQKGYTHARACLDASPSH